MKEKTEMKWKMRMRWKTRMKWNMRMKWKMRLKMELIMKRKVRYLYITTLSFNMLMSVVSLNKQKVNFVDDDCHSLNLGFQVGTSTQEYIDGWITTPMELKLTGVSAYLGSNYRKRCNQSCTKEEKTWIKKLNKNLGEFKKIVGDINEMVKQGESNYLGNNEIKEMCNNWKNEIVWKEVFETENVEDDMNVISLNDDGGAVEGTNVQDPPEEAGTVNDGGTLEGMNVEHGGALEGMKTTNMC
ncbi:uncharacterized protein LOC143629291 [Bidens hawaiensis]|uniref:uncharacterized protein LOC143629291 n=1 Tax=Bidens hawaiensis TaxID=980011 RepID=UPI00404B6272